MSVLLRNRDVFADEFRSVRLCPPGLLVSRLAGLVQFGGDYITGPQADCIRYLPGAARKSPVGRASTGSRFVLKVLEVRHVGGKLYDKHMIVGCRI
jgi:hypothetical protein